jgi:predicted glycosyltransferase
MSAIICRCSLSAAPAGAAAAPARGSQVAPRARGATGPVFSGLLGEFALPDLLEFLRSARQSGVLVCSGAQGMATLTFRDGWIAAEDGVREASRDAYRAIEGAMGEVKTALRAEPIDAARLRAALQHLRRHQPRTRNVLVLRDILDSPEVTRRTWERDRCHVLIREFYDRILVLGAREVFDAPREYGFPASSTDKVQYCGYVPRSPGALPREEVRRALRLREQDQLVLVTAGGGGDGFRLLDTYLTGVARRGSAVGTHSLVVAGPELPDRQRAQLARAAARLPGVTLVEFLDDMMSYIGAADVVVSMGGYNTVCEILSARKRAIVVPRVRPVAEQGMRAERMARLGLFETIHPDELGPDGLFDAVERQLRAAQVGSAEYAGPDLVGLFETGDWAATLLREVERSREQPRPAGTRILRLPGRPTWFREPAAARA